MAVVTRYGTGYKDPAALTQVDAVYAEAIQKSINSKISITSGDTAASVYYVGRVPSNAIIQPDSIYQYQAITGVTDFDVGFANDPDALVDGDDIATAGSQTLLGHGTLTTANSNKKAWELAGLSSDSGGMLDILATIKANAAAAGVVNFTIRYGKAA